MVRHKLVGLGVISKQLDTCIVFDLVEEACFGLLQYALVLGRIAKLINDLHNITSQINLTLLGVGLGKLHLLGTKYIIPYCYQ